MAASNAVAEPHSRLQTAQPHVMDSVPAWASSGNASNDKLLTMPEEGQAAMLSKATHYECLGQHPFYMGTWKRPPNENVSLWSITCSVTGQKYMVAISPDDVGSTKVLSCNLLHGHPWECYHAIK